MNNNDLLKQRPDIPADALKKVYDGFQKFMFFETIKTGHRHCYCTACKKTFECGIHTPRRLDNATWRVADSAHHKEEILCPICGARVTAINVKLQRRLNNPIIDISTPIAFFIVKNFNEVWVRCFFVGRNFSSDGRNIRDYQSEKNAYRFTPQGALYWRKYWSSCFGWNNDGLCREYKYREPFKWDSGLAHNEFPYKIVFSENNELSDSFLKYSAYEKFLSYGRLRYWCWYCDYPQIEMLVKLGHTETVDRMIHTDSAMPRLLDWNAKKPWEFFRLSKPEYDKWCKVESRERIIALKLYKALKLKDGEFDVCRRLYQFSHHQYMEAYKLAKRISGYGRPIQEVFKYFEKISASSAGMCHCCIGITTREVVSMWVDYVNMGDDGKSNFNPFPADLKSAHDNLIEAYRIKQYKKSAATLRREQAALVKKLARKYPKANEHCRALAEKYEYDNGTYAFVTPRNMTDILVDGKTLNQCTGRPDAGGENWRYFERINNKETYIGFVRKSDSKDVPWFTIEFEPGGTVRQKRAYGDDQPADTTPLVSAFLVEWQDAIAPRLTKKDRRDAQAAKAERLVQFEELRHTGKTINYGKLAGTPLIEAFDKDLMEIEIEIA